MVLPPYFAVFRRLVGVIVPPPFTSLLYPLFVLGVVIALVLLHFGGVFSFSILAVLGDLIFITFPPFAPILFGRFLYHAHILFGF
jgi:hypothetical protein